MKVLINNELQDIEISIEDIETHVEIQIEELKKKLSDTDYIACKIAEGSATAEEYAEMIEQRQTWREEINKLEGNNG